MSEKLHLSKSRMGTHVRCSCSGFRKTINQHTAGT